MRQPPKRKRSHRSNSDSIEPRIIDAHTLILSNYLATLDAQKGDVILVRTEHLRDADSLKKQLEAEKQHCLSVIGNEPLSNEQLQRISIIDGMLQNPDATLNSLRILHEKRKKINPTPVSEQDVKDFVHYFKKWPPHIRKIVEHHGCFMFDSYDYAKGPAAHGNAVIIDGGKAEAAVVDMGEIRNMRSGQILQDRALYASLYNAIGAGPDSIDWKGAETELRQKLSAPDFSGVFSPKKKKQQGHPIVEVMHNVAFLIDKFNERTVIEKFPKSFAAYTQYNRHIHSMSAQVRSVDPNTIEFPEIPLLNDENAPPTNRTPVVTLGGDTPPPPPPIPTAGAGHALVPPDDLIRQAEQFVTECLQERPPLNRFRCHLSLQAGHPIVLRFTNHDDSSTREIQLTPNESNLQRAIELKQLVQTHVLNMPGVTAYRKPIVGGEYNLGWGDILPDAAPTDVRLVKANGIFKLELHYQDSGQPIVMGFSLGLLQEETNRQEAERRRGLVTDYITSQHVAHRSLTKGDVVQNLRSGIPSGQWQSAERMAVEGYSRDQRDIAVNFPATQSGQTTTVRVGNLHVSGDPNPAWRLPLQVIPNNGFPIGVDLNLHTLDDSIAQQRAAEVIASLLAQFRNLPQNARWALDEQNMLRQLSPGALATTSDIDATRLRDMLDDLPHYKDDLAVRVVRQQAEGGQIRFSMGIIRGANTTQNERVMEKIGNNPQPVIVERQFTVPAEQANRIDAFERSVNDDFLRYVREEYRPHTEAALEHDGISKRKKSLAYSPKTAPLLLDDAIQAQRDLHTFPEMQSLDSPRINGGRGQWRDISPAAAQQPAVQGR